MFNAISFFENEDYDDSCKIDPKKFIGLPVVTYFQGRTVIGEVTDAWIDEHAGGIGVGMTIKEQEWTGKL